MIKQGRQWGETGQNKERKVCKKRKEGGKQNTKDANRENGSSSETGEEKE